LSFPQGAATFGKRGYFKRPRPHLQWRPERGAWSGTSVLSGIYSHLDWMLHRRRKSSHLRHCSPNCRPSKPPRHESRHHLRHLRHRRRRRICADRPRGVGRPEKIVGAAITYFGRVQLYHRIIDHHRWRRIGMRDLR
jgi:hypothetical protein